VHSRGGSCRSRCGSHLQSLSSLAAIDGLGTSEGGGLLGAGGM
jgi:hypothetical protein